MRSQICNLIFQLVFFRLLTTSFVRSAPCDIINNQMQSSRIEFDENAPKNTILFELPFNTTHSQEIKDIKFKSNELNETILSEYFEIIDLKKFVLKTSYDLDEIQIDLIELLFTCTVSGSQLSTTFLLYITINDVNDNRPQFVSTPYQINIKELTQIGSIVYQNIEAIDKDLPNKPNSQISFSIQDGTCSNYFGFPLTTKSDLAVIKLIRYDQLSKCKLTIKAEDHGYPSLSSTSIVEINIIDIDDKDPIFMNSFYTGLVKRNSLPGTFLNMTPNDISAFDQDMGINATIKYSLRSNPNDLFEINSNTGRLSLKNAINTNDKSEYGVIVKAYQENNPSKSALTMVNIEILNVNEYPPIFEKSSYEIKIKENTKPGTLIGRIQADDRDKNRIEYSILNNHESPFLIDKYKGIIVVNGRLDYEMKSSYLLDVIASDGNFTTQTVVKIELVNIVDKEPYFEFNNYSFKLKIPYDVYIGQVRAIDVEKNENLKYSLKFNDSSDSNLFCISQNGIIYICPTVSQSSKQPNSNDSNTNKATASMFALNNLSDEEMKSKFKKLEYKFNVSASIYSKDLVINLENHVQCKIEIELRSHNLNDYDYNTETNVTSKSMLKPMPPPMFLSEQFLKDASSVYVLVGFLVSALLLLICCSSLVVWFKCSRKKNNSRNKRNSQRYVHHRHDQCDHYFHSKAPFRNMFNAMNEEVDKKNSNLQGVTNGCFSSSSASSISDCNSCKNSTSGISCLSDGSTILTNSKLCAHHQTEQIRKKCECSFKLSSIKALDYLKWQEKNRKSPNSINVDTTSSESTPTSKLTILSEYFCNESQLIKSAKLLTDNNQAYSDILSSTASTLKIRDTPILVRQDSDHYEQDNITDSSNYQVNYSKNKKRVKSRNDNRVSAISIGSEQTSSHSSFKPSSTNYSVSLRQPNKSKNSVCSTTSSSSSSNCNSPKQSVMLSFQPTDNNNLQLTSLEKNRNMFSFIYNYQEPLSDTSETNFDNNEKTIYEDIKLNGKFSDLQKNLQKLDEESFGEHLEQCNNSLNKLADIIEHSNQEQPYIDIEPISDSSFVSVSVDKFSDEQTTSSDSFLSDITPLTSNSKKSNIRKMSFSTSTSTSFSSVSLNQTSPRNIFQSICIKYVKLDGYDSILENETLV